MANIKILRSSFHRLSIRRVMLVSSTDQGLGKIEGIVRQDGSGVENAPVHVFKRSTKTLLWETTTDLNGRFKFRNIAIGLECFVTVFDPTREKNAKIKDMIVAK